MRNLLLQIANFLCVRAEFITEIWINSEVFYSTVLSVTKTFFKKLSLKTLSGPQNVLYTLANPSLIVLIIKVVIRNRRRVCKKIK